MKLKNNFRCNKCAWEEVKWQGKCSNCGAWNSLEQIVSTEKKAFQTATSSQLNLQPETLEVILTKLSQQKEKRLFKFSNSVLNQFWGGGLVAGSFTLLAGEPGLGKSTLALQILKSLYLRESNSDSLVQKQKKKWCAYFDLQNML